MAKVKCYLKTQKIVDGENVISFVEPLQLTTKTITVTTEKATKQVQTPVYEFP
ncbi:MAG: hypothetical protein MJ223_02645 [Mycoplasmoidaceae bacterium]|nr:hypothetical protein [Mycoplasmoidaceae bacterium]